MNSSRRRVFFDASVLFAGCHSPEGASGLIMEACRAGLIEPAVGLMVVGEARGALARKSSSESVARLDRFLAHPDLRVAGVPSPDEIRPHVDLVPSKDCHVIASALAVRAECLLTLDRKHFFTPTVRKATLPFIILTPGEFLEHWRASRRV